jgi:hypothetical protein
VAEHENRLTKPVGWNTLKWLMQRFAKLLSRSGIRLGVDFNSEFLLPEYGNAGIHVWRCRTLSAKMQNSEREDAAL